MAKIRHLLAGASVALMALWTAPGASGATNDLYRANPTTGAIIAGYNIAGGLGSLAYDSVNNVIWAGPGGGSFSANLVKITLDAGKNVTGSTLGFAVVPAGLDDGLALDGPADTMYYSPDGSTTIYTYTVSTGLPAGSFPWT